MSIKLLAAIFSRERQSNCFRHIRLAILQCVQKAAYKHIRDIVPLKILDQLCQYEMPYWEQYHVTTFMRFAHRITYLYFSKRN